MRLSVLFCLSVFSSAQVERFLLRHRTREWVSSLVADSEAWARLTERGAETSALLRRLIATVLVCPAGSSRKRKRGAAGGGGWSGDDDSSRSNSDSDSSSSSSESDS